MSHPNIKPMSLVEILKRCEDPSRFNIVGSYLRPGAAIFAMRLEYENYIPDTPANDDFLYYEIQFAAMGWPVLSIPAKDRHIAERIAQEEGLKLSKGVPAEVVTGEIFPLNSPNTYTLENLSLPRKPVAAMDDELKRCEAIQAAHKREYDAGKFSTHH